MFFSPIIYFYLSIIFVDHTQLQVSSQNHLPYSYSTKWLSINPDRLWVNCQAICPMYCVDR